MTKRKPYGFFFWLLAKYIEPMQSPPPRKNTLYNEDCLATMKRMPDGYVDYIITSPPYNRKRNDKYEDYDDNINDYFDWLVTIIDECLRVTKSNVFSMFKRRGTIKRTFSNCYTTIQRTFTMSSFGRKTTQILPTEIQ